MDTQPSPVTAKPSHPSIDVLEHKLRKFDDTLQDIARARRIAELIRIWKRPGWTTPAEFAFTAAMLDQLVLQVDVIQHLQDQLLAAAGRVGQN